MPDAVQDPDAQPPEGGPASDPATLRATRLTERQRQLRDLEDARNLAATASGRRLLRWLLTVSHVNELSFCPGDPHRTAFNEGERNVGNQILARFRLACPEKLAIMEAEARQESKDHA